MNRERNIPYLSLIYITDLIFIAVVLRLIDRNHISHTDKQVSVHSISFKRATWSGNNFSNFFIVF